MNVLHVLIEITWPWSFCIIKGVKYYETFHLKTDSRNILDMVLLRENSFYDTLCFCKSRNDVSWWIFGDLFVLFFMNTNQPMPPPISFLAWDRTINYWFTAATAMTFQFCKVTTTGTGIFDTFCIWCEKEWRNVVVQNRIQCVTYFCNLENCLFVPFLFSTCYVCAIFWMILKFLHYLKKRVFIF